MSLIPVPGRPVRLGVDDVTYTDASETLQELIAVSSQPIGPLMRALASAVAVMGDDMVRRALALMAARPARPPILNKVTLGHEPPVQGTPVAPTKRLWQWEVDREWGPSFTYEPLDPDSGGRYKRDGLQIYDGSSWRPADTVDPTKLDYVQPIKMRGYLAPAVEGAAATIRAELEKAGIPVWSATGGPNWQDVIDTGTAKRDEPEATVTEAVTDEVAAAMAAGDVVEAQRLLLAGLDNVGAQETVAVPKRAPVMPMPRAPQLPSFSFGPPDYPAARTSTGKPCRVCMRPAFHIHSSPSGKPWHYCDDHEPEA